MESGTTTSEMTISRLSFWHNDPRNGWHHMGRNGWHNDLRYIHTSRNTGKYGEPYTMYFTTKSDTKGASKRFTIKITERNPTVTRGVFNGDFEAPDGRKFQVTNGEFIYYRPITN
jgi:hypothetical protein